MKKIKIQLYGEFRTFSASSSIDLDCNMNDSIFDVRNTFSKTLKSIHKNFDEKLLSDSVFATEAGILEDSDSINGINEIAVLPPVCGG